MYTQPHHTALPPTTTSLQILKLLIHCWQAMYIFQYKVIFTKELYNPKERKEEPSKNSVCRSYAFTNITGEPEVVANFLSQLESSHSRRKSPHLPIPLPLGQSIGDYDLDIKAKLLCWVGLHPHIDTFWCSAFYLQILASIWYLSFFSA